MIHQSVRGFQGGVQWVLKWTWWSTVLVVVGGQILRGRDEQLVMEELGYEGRLGQQIADVIGLERGLGC